MLTWNGPSLAGAICYEISDGNNLAKAIANGAEWILAIANLDPYPISLQNQFIALAQLRSIETSRDTITVSNTGPSTLILANGTAQKIIPPFKNRVDVTQLHLRKEITGYVLWREGPLIGLFVTSFIGLNFSVIVTLLKHRTT